MVLVAGRLILKLRFGPPESICCALSAFQPVFVDFNDIDLTPIFQRGENRDRITLPHITTEWTAEGGFRTNLGLGKQVQAW